jgi:hypothetical protein
MPQLDNKQIIECILKSTISVINRRTSDAYANVIIDNSLKKLNKKYNFLNLVKIKKSEYQELFDNINIEPDINNVNKEKIGLAIRDLIQDIIHSLGKNAGYYFIREIKELLSFEYEKIIKEIGIDLDLMQFLFITEKKQALKFEIKNDDILKYLFMSLYEFLDREIGRDSAYKNLDEVVTRFRTEYECLNYVKINDVRALVGVDSVIINSEVNKIESSIVGMAIQKCIQELNNNFVEKGFYSFIEQFREILNFDYIFKIESIGVNFNVIQYDQVSVIKHIFKALIDVLGSYSSETYTIFMIKNLLNRYEDNFLFFNLIKIDNTNITDGLNAISISSEIESYRTSELGRGLQKIIEEISISLGEDAGKNFLDDFKNRLGKAYILKMEDMGVNLHMIELKQNLLW